MDECTGGVACWNRRVSAWARVCFSVQAEHTNATEKYRQEETK